MNNNLVFLVAICDVKGSTNISQARSFLENGYNVIPINYRTIIQNHGMQFFEKFLVESVNEYKPRIVLFSKCNGINPELVKFCSQYSVTWLWNMDSIQTIKQSPEVVEHAKNADFSSCTGEGTTKWFQKQGVTNCMTLFDGLDPIIFKPVEPKPEYIADISFIGAKNDERDLAVKKLVDAGYKVKTYGPGYEKAVYDEDFAAVCSSSQLMLSMNTYNNIPKYFSNRLLRYMGCGSCVLHYDPTETLNEVFEDEKEIVYFTNIEDVAEKANYIFDNLDRDKIGTKAKEKVLNNYTWDHTIKNILDKVEDYVPKESRNAIVVTNIGRDKIWDICGRSVKKYCEKYNIALEIITESKLNLSGIPEGYNHTNFEKYQTYELFDKYDRIIRLDCDIIISPNCPNLFDIVPEDSIGVVFEDKGSRQKHRRENNIVKIQEQLGNVNWKKDYFNSGIMVCSKQHRDLFKITEDDREAIKNNDFGGVSKEQSFVNWRVRKFGFKVHELDYRFNHTTMFSEDWNNNANRYDSFIIHYAGQGKFINCKDKCENMMIDDNYFYSKNIQPLTLKDIAIINSFPLINIESYLNVGCGKGRLDYHLKEKGLPIISTDIEKNNLIDDNIDFHIADIFDVGSFPIEKADVVICSQVLEHIKDYKIAFKNLLELTNIRLIITIPHKTSFFDEGHLNFWDDTEYDGFKPISEFIELCNPFSIAISKIITKDKDIKTGSRNYLIVIDKTQRQ